jgi:hypothetical protein
MEEKIPVLDITLESSRKVTPISTELSTEIPAEIEIEDILKGVRADLERIINRLKAVEDKLEAKRQKRFKIILPPLEKAEKELEETL